MNGISLFDEAVLAGLREGVGRSHTIIESREVLNLLLETREVVDLGGKLYDAATGRPIWTYERENHGAQSGPNKERSAGAACRAARQGGAHASQTAGH